MKNACNARFVSMLWVGIFCAVAVHAQKPTGSFFPGTPADEAAIRAMVTNASNSDPDPHFAPDLDWEKAFGIRFFDVKARDDWYNKGVKPQFATATSTSIEVNVRFIEPNVAVADEYWHVVGQIYAGETRPGPDRWGRTTYIFTKANGVWTEVMERVADLRSPYFKHYSEIPKSVPIPAATLASYAGTYVGPTGKTVGVMTVEGDHLKTKYPREDAYVAVPLSPTEFLEFNPNMIALYQKLKFTTLPDGTISCAFARADDEPQGTATKTRQP